MPPTSSVLAPIFASSTQSGNSKNGKMVAGTLNLNSVSILGAFWHGVNMSEK